MRLFWPIGRGSRRGQGDPIHYRPAADGRMETVHPAKMAQEPAAILKAYGRARGCGLRSARLTASAPSERTTSRSPQTCHYRSAGFFSCCQHAKWLRRAGLSYDSPDSVRSPVKYFSVKMESRRMPTSFSPPSGMIRSAYFLEGSMNASCIGLTVVRY